MRSFDSLKRGSHVFVICHSKDLRLYDFDPFLKNGIDNNELVLIFLENYSKYQKYDKMNKFIFFSNQKFNNRGNNIFFKQTGDWFRPGHFINAEVYLKKWGILINQAINNGKEGVRILVETNKFLRDNLDNSLISFDRILQELYGFPITSLYIYRNTDIGAMTPQQVAILKTNCGFLLNELVTS